MKVRRSRVVAAAPDEVWATIGDPYHLPRWWPRVERVELVQGDGFTQLLRTDKGRAIRADKHHHDPGKYVYRAYGLANFAHDVLSQAEPALAKRGCDVSPLL